MQNMKSLSLFVTVHPRTAIGIGVSILIHALILLFAMVQPSPRDEGPGEAAQMPLTARLIPRQPASEVKSSAAVILEPAPPPKKARPKKVSPQPEKIIARRKADSKKPDTPALPPSPLPAPEPPNATAAPTDMMGMINAARERRRAEGIPTETAESNSESPQPGNNDIAAANIAHSMQVESRGRNGAGGVFQITHKGVRNAQFLFRGWGAGNGANLRQLVEVDAGPNGDVELAIVRKMIELIRKHQPKEFSWNSHRLGRVIVLSARIEDSAALEKFLKNEFFDAFP